MLRRNKPGTKAEQWCSWPEMKFEEMDSTLNVQQYIQQTIRKDPADINAILTPPKGQDEAVWKCEHLRQFCMELNGLAVLLLEHCDPAVCTQMAATEQWIYLCAAHRTPKECTAIDYVRHTLDGAACLLNSSKYFPSRISIKETAVAKLGSICRRVYRIFSHAYFNHKSIFDLFEEQTHLCQRFTCFVLKFNLMQHEHLIIPCFADMAGFRQDQLPLGDSDNSQQPDVLNETTIVTGESGERRKNSSPGVEVQNSIQKFTPVWHWWNARKHFHLKTRHPDEQCQDEENAPSASQEDCLTSACESTSDNQKPS